MSKPEDIGKIVGRLMAGLDAAWASESRLRALVFEDTGRMPGADTVRRTIDRDPVLHLQREGRVEVRYFGRVTLR